MGGMDSDMPCPWHNLCTFDEAEGYPCYCANLVDAINLELDDRRRGSESLAQWSLAPLSTSLTMGSMRAEVPR